MDQNLAENNLELQWPLWGTLDFPKLILLKIKLESCGWGKGGGSSWMGCLFLNGTLKLTDVFRILFVSLQNTISVLTEANHCNKSKWFLGPLSSPTIFSVCSHIVAILCSGSTSSTLFLYSLCWTLLFFCISPTHSSSEPTETCLFKVKVLNLKDLNKPHIFYVPWTKARL